MGRRSSARRCLFCFAPCNSGGDPLSLSSSRPGQLLSMAGAVNCDQLQLQLEHMFILRKVLNVPASWCEETLVENSDPANWFHVCEGCAETKVTHAWGLYQQILALEVELVTVREQIKKGMKREMLNVRNRKWVQSGAVKVEGKIRNLLFPDLVIPKLETEEMTHDVKMEVDRLSNCSDDWLQNEDDEYDNSNDCKPSRKTRKQKGRRGRPPGKKGLKRSKQFDKPKDKKWRCFCCRFPDCRAKYGSPEELERHKQAHEEREENGGRRMGDNAKLDCLECCFPAQTPEELERHITRRHKPKERGYFYKCPLCAFTSEEFITLKEHFDEDHPPSKEQVVVNEGKKSSELPVLCPLCMTQFEHLKAITYHQKFSHPEQVGIQVETLECNQCGKKFPSEFLLRRHVKKEHIKQGKYVCEECGKGFEFLSRLEQHKVQHINKLKRDYVCHLCGLDYAYKELLGKHYKNCHPDNKTEVTSKGGPSSSEETSNKCRYCEMSFPIRGLLIRHMEQHKQEMGNKCPECGKCYVNNAGLRRHLKINHPLVKEDIPCPYCLKNFTSVEYMRDHMSKYCKLKSMEDQSTESSKAATSRNVATVTSEMNTDQNTFKRAPVSEIGYGEREEPQIQNHSSEPQQEQSLQVQPVYELSLPNNFNLQPQYLIKVDYVPI